MKSLISSHSTLCEVANDIAGVAFESKRKLQNLEEQIAIATSDGNWNYDPYMHGYANGLILARATLTGEEPKFLTAPKIWGHQKDGKIAQGQRTEGDRAYGTNGSSEGRVAEDNAKTIRRN